MRAKIVKKKTTPKLNLSDLLRRRKLSLQQFLKESGVTTYNELVIRCGRIGVQPPTHEDFSAVVNVVVSSPTEGVVVLEPLKTIDDSGAKVEETSASSDALFGAVIEQQDIDEGKSKKNKKKRDPWSPTNNNNGSTNE